MIHFKNVFPGLLVLLAALPLSAGPGDGRYLTRNLSNNAADNSSAQISGSNVVWQGNADGNYNIYLHDGTGVTNLSNNAADNYSPQISGSNVVWKGNVDGNYDIYLHDGTSVANLSNNASWNEAPQISGSNVAWRGNADGNYDIYLHDGTGVTNLSNSSAINTYASQISGSNVVWEKYGDGNYDIYLYDGTGVTNLSNNAANNRSTQVSGSNVVWQGDADGNNDIYLHDGTGVTNLSDNAAGNYSPQISGSNVVWQGDADGNNNIYAAYWLGPDAVLNNVDLSGEDLSDVDFSNADMTDANLTGADLANAILSGATVTTAQILTTSSIAGANVSGFDFSGDSFSGQDLSGTQFDSANLTGADFSNTDLQTTNFTNADLTNANLDQSQLPAALPSLPVINDAVVTVVNNLDVSGAVQVDTGGNILVTSDSFTATNINMQGGTVHGSMFGLDLDEIGDVSGHGRLFGDVDLGTDGVIAGSGAGLELFGHVSGSGTISDTAVFGDLNIGNSPGVITLENVVLSAAGTTMFEVAGTDLGQFDQLMLVGSVDLDGLAAISFDSFTPDPSDTFQLIDMTSGWASSWFSSVTTPEGWILTSSGLLAIPEPTAVSLLAVGVLMACRRRRVTLSRR